MLIVLLSFGAFQNEKNEKRGRIKYEHFVCIHNVHIESYHPNTSLYERQEMSQISAG